MSGLRKQKKYCWKDTNLSLFGSDLEKNVKRESAQTEEAWKGAGTEVGLQIWRIVKFKVTHWPKEDYGKFFNGDSYIILHTYKKDPDSEVLDYDVHFWIGKESTQDEYGTAAYKTVELDHFLNDKPVQHREVEGHESDLFKSYFSTLVLMKGGCDSGFKKVVPKEYSPRLFAVTQGIKGASCCEKKMKRENMSNDGVYIIDSGTTIRQWYGKDAKPCLKFAACKFATDLESERCGKAASDVLDNQTIEDFNPKLSELIPEGKPKKQKKPAAPFEKTLLRLSDATGQLQFEKVSPNDIDRSALKKDVFILDTGKHCYIWSGAEASIEERSQSMQRAHNYMQKSEHPFCPITVTKDKTFFEDAIGLPKERKQESRKTTKRM